MIALRCRGECNHKGLPLRKDGKGGNPEGMGGIRDD